MDFVFVLKIKFVDSICST